MKMRRSEYPTDSALERLRRFVTGNARKQRGDEQEALQEEREARPSDHTRDADRQD